MYSYLADGETGINNPGDYLFKNGNCMYFSLFFGKLAFYFNQKVYPKIHL
jgi:hypothetical protein